MDDDNDLIRADQRDAAGSETAHEAQRNLGAILASDLNQIGVEVTAAGVLYGTKKAVGLP